MLRAFRHSEEAHGSLARPQRRRARLALAWALTFAAASADLGCARLSNYRKRIFYGDTSVPAMELADLPATHAAGPPGRGGPGAGLRRTPGQPLAWQTVGRSVQGRPIEVAQFGANGERVLLIGGIHGDEPEGLPLAERLAEELAADPRLHGVRAVTLVRDLNPDGTAAATRTNSNGVDLNRNFPAANWEASARAPRFHPGPQPASEPETRVLLDLLRDFAPARIVVMHATRGKPMVNYDGPARELAEAMSQLNGYVTSDTIGYPTPGSLGSYAGKDLGIPIITLELPRGISADAAWQANRAALLEVLASGARDR